MVDTVLCVINVVAEQYSVKVLPLRGSGLVWAGLVG